jgi:hypothetical protein
VSLLDDAVAQARCSGEDVVGVEARRDDLGAHELDVDTFGQALLGDQQRTRHLPSGHQAAGEQQIRDRAGEHRIRVGPGVGKDEVDHVEESGARRLQAPGDCGRGFAALFHQLGLGGFDPARDVPS